MVAKISKGASLYEALTYNQQKVDNVEAAVIHSQRIIHDENIKYNIEDCMKSFEIQLTANNRTKKPVVHISLNPDPKDKVDDEFAKKIAQDYLDKMGYGNQPYLLYKHNDIERVHFHIVTVCVDDNGVKINDKYEKRRSMDACRELEKEYRLNIPTKAERRSELRAKPVDYTKGKLTKQIRNTVGALIGEYKISSFSEYRTLLEQFGCTYTHMDGRIGDKPIHGIFYSAIDENKTRNSTQLKSSLFGKEYGYELLQKKFQRDKKRIKQTDIDFTKRIIVQCMYQCETRSKEELISLLKNRGVDLVLHTNKENRVFGTTFINHNNQTVMNGSKIGQEFSANYLSNFFDNPHFIIPFPNDNSPAKEKEEEIYEKPFESVFSLLPEWADPDETLRKKKKKKNNNKYNF